MISRQSATIRFISPFITRRPGVFAPDLLHHIIARGNQRQRTFLSEADYQAYLKRLATYRHWTVSRQQTRAAYIFLVRRKGYGVGEVAAQLGWDVSTMTVVLSRFADRVAREPALRGTVERVAKIVKIKA